MKKIRQDLGLRPIRGAQSQKMPILSLACLRQHFSMTPLWIGWLEQGQNAPRDWRHSFFGFCTGGRYLPARYG
jgi:hypothetical protein